MGNDNIVGQVGAALNGLAQQASHGSEGALRQLALQVAVILIACGLGATFARRVLKQPAVVGQILTGIVLGPTVLGALAPRAHALLLPESSIALLRGLAELGLVLLVFEVGLDIDFRRHAGREGVRHVLTVGLLSFCVPLVAGYFAAPWFLQAGHTAIDVLGFRMIFACSLAITAVPVLARILSELKLTRSRIGAVSIGAAAVNDLLGWVVVSAIVAYAGRGFDGATLAVQGAAIVVGLLVVFVLIGPILGRFIDGELKASGGQLAVRALTWLLIVICIASVVSSMIGVFALIGSFVVGAALHRQRALSKQWQRSVAPLVQALFVPLFFTLTGLRTDLRTLDAGSWALCGLAFVLAVTTKVGSGYLGGRLCGQSKADSFALGIAMNTRGLMELIVLNLGLELGLLPRSVFSMLVLTAIASTYMAAPLLRRALRLSNAEQVKSAQHKARQRAQLQPVGGVP